MIYLLLSVPYRALENGPCLLTLKEKGLSKSRRDFYENLELSLVGR